ncbi:hypothetical protein D3C71_1814290 [compost metagenome]
MIMRRDIGNTETDRNNVKKSRLGKSDAVGTQIIARMKDQLVSSGDKSLADQDRPAIDPPICIGLHRLDRRPRGSLDTVKLDHKPFGRLAACRVEHMGGETGHRLGSEI